MDLFQEGHVDKLIFDTHALLDRMMVEQVPFSWAPLLSGGHDSICAVHVCSLHKESPKPYIVHHIDTGTGAQYTRDFVERLCEKRGWTLVVHKSPKPEDRYEEFVKCRGMPGPGRHSWVYARLKERSIQKIVQEGCLSQRPTMLLTGSRKQESTRRMGYAQEVRRGDGLYADTGHLRNPTRLWVAPCYNWVPADQVAYMDEFGLPYNKVKVALGLSGECFCGAMASPGEFQQIRDCPLTQDVADRIEVFQRLAKEAGQPCIYGQSPATHPDDEDMPLMDLCAGCERRRDDREN